MSDKKIKLSDDMLDGVSGGTQMDEFSVGAGRTFGKNGNAAMSVRKKHPHGAAGQAQELPMFCSNCGSTFTINGSENVIECPSCGYLHVING